MNPYDVGASGPDSMGYMARAMVGEPTAKLALFYSTILQTERMRRHVAEQYARTCEELGRPPFLVVAPGQLSPEEMHVYCEHVGGGFGAKQEMLTEEICVLAALQTGRPVKLELTREEEFVTVTKHGVNIKMKTGLDANGKILARQSTCYFNTGA